MEFAAFTASIESILLVDHAIELRPTIAGDDHVVWTIGLLKIRLTCLGDGAALSATIEDQQIAPASYSLDLRGARDVAFDLSVLLDIPSSP